MTRTHAESLAALRAFRDHQTDPELGHDVIDEESGLTVRDVDAAIAAMEEMAEMVSIPVIDLSKKVMPGVTGRAAEAKSKP